MPKSLTPTERKRKQRNSDNSNRKNMKLDTLFMFGEVDISVIVDNDGKVWYKGVDLARALEMKNPNTAIYDVVDKMHYTHFEQLASNNIKLREIPNMHPKTTFVNETGMNLFVMRSRKPKAEAFSQWVCGRVLPSIRKTDKYEIEDSEDNPYKDENDFLTIQNKNTSEQKEKDSLLKELQSLQKKNDSLQKEEESLQKEKELLQKQLQSLQKEKASELKEKESQLKEKESQLKELLSQLKEKDSLLNDLCTRLETSRSETIRVVDKILTMQPNCVPELKNPLKKEYVIILRRPGTFYPYYCIRRQEHTAEEAVAELKKMYPNRLLKLTTPNSVNFYNFLLEHIPHMERQTRNPNKFRLKEPYGEDQFIRDVKNYYRTTYGVDATRDD